MLCFDSISFLFCYCFLCSYNKNRNHFNSFWRKLINLNSTLRMTCLSWSYLVISLYQLYYYFSISCAWWELETCLSQSYLVLFLYQLYYYFSVSCAWWKFCNRPIGIACIWLGPISELYHSLSFNRKSHWNLMIIITKMLVSSIKLVLGNFYDLELELFMDIKVHICHAKFLLQLLLN